MQTLRISLAQLIIFSLVDTDGLPLDGLEDGFSASISKNGGVFAAGTGAKAEVGSGWYSYELTASETDTAGPLAVTIGGTGVARLDLVYQVAGSLAETPAGPNILTAAEAAIVLRCEETDADMLALLPLVDAYIKTATGRDWAADAAILPQAKAAARLLLVRWHEDPGMMSSSGGMLGPALTSCLSQLEAMALSYRTFHGRAGVGACELDRAEAWDKVESVVGLLGVTGDQSSQFEAMISVDGEIQQTSTSDLSAMLFRVQLVSPEEL